MGLSAGKRPRRRVPAEWIGRQPLRPDDRGGLTLAHVADLDAGPSLATVQPIASSSATISNTSGKGKQATSDRDAGDSEI